MADHNELRRSSSDAVGDGPKSPLLPLHDKPPPPNHFHLIRSILTVKNLSIVSGPLVCGLIRCFVHLDGRDSARDMLAAVSWVFLWWLTSAVPMAVTSMSPLFLFPLFGIAAADDVAKSYMDDIIALVLGTFILAIAVEHYNIHRRLALNITSVFCGDPVRPRMLLLGICATSTFVSMWMHNTPAAMMMIPVATGILQRFPEAALAEEADVKKFSKGVVLGVVYAVAIGGMSTLTGTGVNLILVGMWESYFPKEKPISFSTWFFFAFPFALLLFFALWGILCLMYCSKGSQKALSAYLDRAHLRRELQLLGPMAFAEKMVLTVFGLLVVLWMTRSLTNTVPGWGALFNGRVGDGTVSVSTFPIFAKEYAKLYQTLIIITNSRYGTNIPVEAKSAHMNSDKFDVVDNLTLVFLTSSYYDNPTPRKISDGGRGNPSIRRQKTIPVMMATLLFIIPSKSKEGGMLMDWAKCKRIHWDVILLLGAGFAIADSMQTSGLSDVLSANLAFLEKAPYLAIAPLVCLVSGTITEFMSNNAAATLVIPLLVELAETMKVHPLLLMVPGAIGAQFAFLLPTSTPSNIVGFTTGHIEIKDMIKTGLALKVAGIAAISILMPTLGALVFETSKPP